MKITVLFILVPILVFGQIQIGEDIDGEAADDFSGRYISLSDDGSIVAIGAYSNDGNGQNSGHVRVYKNIGDVWTQVGDDINGETAGDGSGINSLSCDGSIVAIGAPGNGTSGFPSGHVRVYENTGGVWIQVGDDIDGDASNDRSGTSVSLSCDGSIVAIGAQWNDGNGSDSGHVQIYQNIGDVWTQVGEDIDGETGGDWLGRTGLCLSSDGSIVAAGSGWNNGNGSQSGHVRVYQNIEGIWTQAGDDIDGEKAGDFFGFSVSLSNNVSTAAIGAVSNNGNGQLSGHVRVYDLSEALLSVNDVSLQDNVILYPNPALKTMRIKLNENAILEKIKIYNNLGQLVLTDTDTTTDISGLIPGAYYVKVITKNDLATKQMIVK